MNQKKVLNIVLIIIIFMMGFFIVKNFSNKDISVDNIKSTERNSELLTEIEDGLLNQTIVKKTGIIWLIGNEPFVKTALFVDDGMIYCLTGTLEGELAKNYQSKKVSIEGFEVKKFCRTNNNTIEVTSIKEQ